MTQYLNFPALPGLSINITRTSMRSTRVISSLSLVEQRAAWWVAPRYIYTLNFNFFRQSNHQATEDELKVLCDFYEAHNGGLFAFYFTDPVDGVTRKVRFHDTTLDAERILSGVWDGMVKLISFVDESFEQIKFGG